MSLTHKSPISAAYQGWKFLAGCLVVQIAANKLSCVAIAIGVINTVAKCAPLKDVAFLFAQPGSATNQVIVESYATPHVNVITENDKKKK